GLDGDAIESAPADIELSNDLTTELADADAYAFIVGDGQLGEGLRHVLGDPRYDMVLRGVRAIALAVKIERESTRCRFAVDAPMLLQIGQLAKAQVRSEAP